MLEGISDRVASARLQKGLSLQDVATALDINTSWAQDLEMHEDDLPCTLSLERVCRLAKLLGTSPRALVWGSDQLASERITPEMVVEAMRAHMVAGGQSVEEFTETVGWEVRPVLDDPSRMWSEWCIEQAQDVCAIVAMEWWKILPSTNTEPTV
jgi:transcriptional regulator with XRE-family HTH domain